MAKKCGMWIVVALFQFSIKNKVGDLLKGKTYRKSHHTVLMPVVKILESRPAGWPHLRAIPMVSFLLNVLRDSEDCRNFYTLPWDTKNSILLPKLF